MQAINQCRQSITAGKSMQAINQCRQINAGISVQANQYRQINAGKSTNPFSQLAGTPPNTWHPSWHSS